MWLFYFSSRGERKKFLFFFSSRRRHTRSLRDWSSDVCSSDLGEMLGRGGRGPRRCRRRTGRQRDAAAAAELLAGLNRGATRGADRREHRTAFGTVPALCTVVVVTG